MFATVRAQSAEAGDYKLYARTPDARWDAAVAAAKDVAFVPGDATRDLALFQEIAWRANGKGKPIRLVYAARDSQITLARLKSEDADFAAGRLDPDRLYVLAPDTPVPDTAILRRTTIDGVPVVLPVSALKR
jgi:hypothetical protein